MSHPRAIRGVAHGDGSKGRGQRLVELLLVSDTEGGHPTARNMATHPLALPCSKVVGPERHSLAPYSARAPVDEI